MLEITIAKHPIGHAHPPFIVAELSGNHQGSIDRALALIEEAKKAGVDAVKFQTYTPDTITLKGKEKGFSIEDQSSLWKGRSLYDLYQEAYTPWEWHEKLFEKCRSLNLLAFSTPFDETAVDFLEKFDVPCYKIASLEIVDLPLIKKAANTKKPLIISVGGASLIEIAEAVDAARSAGCKELILLKCTSAYPAEPIDAHLRTLPHLSAAFKTPVGLSDHTHGLAVPLAAISLGCSFVEKHLTYSREEGGVDSAFSLEPQEFKTLVQEAKRAWQALGLIHYGPLDAEKTSLSHRPSLYFIQDLPSGTRVLKEHFQSLRPNVGLPPKEGEYIVGLILKKDVMKGTPVNWNLFN